MMNRKDIRELEQAGLIRPEQAAAIAEHLRHRRQRLHKWLHLCLLFLAGWLILCGIISLIAANWDSIPDLAKMSTGIALLLGFWGAAIATRTKQPVLSETLGFLGSGMWVADVALYAQIFQLQSPPVEGLFVLWLGLILIPFLCCQRLLALAAAIATPTLLGFILFTPTAESPLGLGLSENTYMGCLFLLAPLAVGILAEHARSATGFYRHYAWLRIPALLFFGGFSITWPLFPHDVFPADSYVWAFGGCLLLALLKPRSIAWAHWAALAGGTLLLLAVCLGFSAPDNELFKWLRLGCYFAYGVLWMLMGGKTQRIGCINLGGLLILLAAYAMLCDFLGSLTDTGIGFILMGLLLLGCGYLIRNQRQKLQRHMND
ncbi:MAG: DUF2157 domain-containing protein [Akkermansia sp.]